MKLLFTSTLVLLFTIVQGMQLPTDPLEKGKKEQVKAPVNPVSNPSTLISIESLQQENAQLKVKLASLENIFEEERSNFQYKLTMLTLLNKLEDEKKNQSLEDLRLKVIFNETMTNSLFMLQKVTIQ